MQKSHWYRTKILAIDDNKNNLITIKAVLEDLFPQCEILTAKSGVEGINITKEKLPDVILLDIIMPIMDGFDVCKQLKSDKDLKHIPVVLITAIKADAESRVKGLESGADAFFTKPIDSSELHAQVSAMLRIKKAEDKLRKQKNKLNKLVYEKTKKLNKSNKALKQALIKAEESDKLKSAFLSTMSHELRTPLNAIIGFSYVIANSEHLEDEIKDFANSIFSAGNDLLKIIEDIFDISLIEADEVKIIKENIFLNEILNEIHKTFFDNEKILNNQVNFILNKELEDGEDIIHTDETKLNKILKNLIENAFKFTHKGTIEFGYTVKANKDTSCMQFYVKDTGIGIHKDKQSIIFERLRQLDDSHTRNFGGIGLGLHISKKLVEMLGGKIWVESEEDKGSIFYFTIPHNNYIKKTDDINFLIQAKKTKFDWKDKTILLVEDDIIVYKFIKLILTKSNAKLLWAKNGREAIKFFELNDKIDLVLMDIQLPDINGYELTKKMKKLKKHIPVIAQTAYALAGDKEKSYEAGCDYYISKPIEADKFINVIDKFI